MLGRRRLFAVEPLGGRDGVGEDLTHGCVVPGVMSTYRQIPDVAPVCSSDSWKGQDALRDPQGHVPLLKLASQDSGVEMAVGDSSPATSPGFSQDSLNFEPLGSAESLALGALEPPAPLSRLLASRKLEQVLERSRRFSVPPASLSQCCHSPELPPGCEMPHSEARGQEATEAESDPEDGLEQAEVVEGLGPEACPGLPGQGLRYLEHLCLVLEQVANLQRLCLQLQTQSGPGNSLSPLARPREPVSPVHRILKRRRRQPWRLHLRLLTPQTVRCTGRGNGSATQRRQVSANCISLCILPAQGPTGRPPELWA
ncbi:uncharacterized protein C8orf58 homolog isoform X3 [Cervus canadensis]|uniref:uncharacterized protein C8orf58 homolog isoform X3 n=1 Tax=Cervus canadensis TaxID=1574408 RepID=UPI001CA331D6|nr:uncharacterized protein C8orf58 homolog isoform X3 [Cervus canadensis]